MSIQRYDILHPKMRDTGRFVLYADHIADKDADLHHLLSTLADIRIALGVGEKPMLSELAGIVRTRMGVIKILEREAKENAAEVERLTAERDALDQGMDQANADTEETRKEMVQWREWCIKARAERDAAIARAEGAEEFIQEIADDKHYKRAGWAARNFLQKMSSPPADASKMGGEKKPAPYIPEPGGGPEGE